MAAAHVQSAQGSYGGSTSATATFGSNVTTGNLIVVFVDVNSVTATINTPTDTGGNTYTALDTTTGLNSRTKGFYAKNVTGGSSFGVTATLGAGAFGSISVHEASGLDTTAPLDQHVGNAQTSVATTTDAVTSTAVTTTTAGQYIAGRTTQDNVEGITVTQGTGYTAGQTTNNGGQSGKTEYQIQSSAGSIAATFTSATASKNWVTQIATFKAASAGGFTPKFRKTLSGLGTRAGGRQVHNS